MTEHLPGIYGLAPNMIELTNYGSSMDCLKKEIEKAKTACQPWSTPVPSTGDNYFDDCVVEGYFMQGRCTSGTDPYPKGPWTPVTACDYYIWGGAVRGNEGQIYLDRNCNPKPYPAAGVRVCDAAFFNWRVSPVSLVWPAGSTMDETFSSASFPLNPGKEGKVYKWRASEKLPLLVYDPTHSGRITSAFQLFGDWTFGGKRTASADSAQTPETRWRDGYEALATMDTNGDAVVSGNELESLGLWFDNNRNGISEDGEVRPVLELGIRELYYTPDSRDGLTSTIRASKGYKVAAGGQTEVGSSIDWYGEEAASSFELVQRQLAENTFSSAGSYSSAARPQIVSEDKEPSELRNNPQLNISGAWIWKGEGAEDGSKDQLQGVLVFQENRKGEVFGHSLVETPFRAGIGDYRSMVQLLPFTGKRSGSDALEFVVPRPDGSKVVSTAKLSKDGTTLSGNSVAKLNFRGEKGEIQYRWTAARMK